ncbi:MAG: hypothetical protein H6Q19_1709 [Bacteroidetes bacterium]|nr:hypothetical protein [Bacteroidota bacterium]
MKQITIFLLFLLFLAMATFAQQTVVVSVITLKTGEKYRGEIVVRNDKILMLKTEDGKRYQFWINEIEKIKQEPATVSKSDNVQVEKQKNMFGGMLSLDAGLCSAPGAIASSPVTNISVALGTHRTLGTNAFLGIGSGIETVFTKNTVLSYMPLFIGIHNDFGKVFACGLKTGYDFALNKLYKGGPMAEITGGIRYRLTDTAGMYFGLFGQIRQINGPVTEKTSWGDFTGINNDALYNLGLKASYTF